MRIALRRVAAVLVIIGGIVMYGIPAALLMAALFFLLGVGQ